LRSNHVSYSAFGNGSSLPRTSCAKSATLRGATRQGERSERHVDVTILPGEFASGSATTGSSERMTTSTKASGRTVRTRPPSVVWLLASGVLAACSLLAPSDEHYLGGGPAPANEDGGDGGEGGHNGHGGRGGRGGESGHGGDGLGGRTNSAGEGGSAGSEAGGSNGGEGGDGDGPLICDAGFADCNGKASDGCEIDLRSSRENCGGCGKAYACTDDEVCEKGTRFSVSGCSDGNREAFLPVATWPRIAGCTAKWSIGSMRDAKTGVACGFEGNQCPVPADACGSGWHVCGSPLYGPTEISSQATAHECATQHGAFAAAVGDQHCEPCSEEGDGAACCGDACVPQYGNCIYPGATSWFGIIDGHTNLCGAIESHDLRQGVLCCRTP